MEGDGPTGAFVLPNYFQIIADLKKKESAGNRGSAFHPMYRKMITKLKVYQDEALKCETLLMATMLHPTFRLKLIQHCWPDIANKAKSLLEQHFNKRESLLKDNTSDMGISEKNSRKIVESDNIFEMFNAPPTIDENKELEVYIKNMDRLPVPNAKDPNSILIWWKVWIILIGDRSFCYFDHKLK